MPWTLSELTGRQKALLYALIDIRLDNADKIAKNKD